MSIVFNFTGPVTIEVSGHTTIALPAGELPFATAPAATVAPVEIDPDADDKATLLELLNDPKYRFRKLSTLADAIGQGEPSTIELLESIGARQELDNSELYGLISRVGE